MTYLYPLVNRKKCDDKELLNEEKTQFMNVKFVKPKSSRKESKEMYLLAMKNDDTSWMMMYYSLLCMLCHIQKKDWDATYMCDAS